LTAAILFLTDHNEQERAMASAVEQQILEQLDVLTLEQQSQVLAYIRSLMQQAWAGTPGHALLPLAGTIPLEDLEEMGQAIEEGCEQIDRSEW
jgi:hypothetical protein